MSPNPKRSDFGMTIFEIAHQSGWQVNAFRFIPEPVMSGGEIELVSGSNEIRDHLIRTLLDSSPEINHKSVQIVDDLSVMRSDARSIEKQRQRSAKRVDDEFGVAKTKPYLIGDFVFHSEVKKRRAYHYVFLGRPRTGVGVSFDDKG